MEINAKIKKLCIQKVIDFRINRLHYNRTGQPKEVSQKIFASEIEYPIEEYINLENGSKDVDLDFVITVSRYFPDLSLEYLLSDSPISHLAFVKPKPFYPNMIFEDEKFDFEISYLELITLHHALCIKVSKAHNPEDGAFLIENKLIDHFSKIIEKLNKNETL